MGQTPGSDYPIDLACSTCFGSGQPIGKENTPEFIRATIAGVIQCPGADLNVNGVYTLEQTAACVWELSVGSVHLYFDLFFLFGGNRVTYFHLRDTLPLEQYFFFTGPLCTFEFANSQGPGDCDFLVFGHSGTCVITWGPGIT